MFSLSGFVSSNRRLQSPLYLAAIAKFKQIDLASRTYNYLPEGTKHSEPSCYHTGWANKWVVQQFRKRHPVFINDKCYLWTDGNKPNGDLHTSIDQYKEDLVHYSAEGETYWGGKVFDYYSQFSWFV